MNRTTTRVFVAHDHPLILTALIGELAQLGFRVVGKADNFADTKSGIRHTKPDVIIYGLSGTGAAKGKGEYADLQELQKRYQDARVIVLTVLDSVPAISLAYEAGAKGVFSTRMTPSLIGDAVKKVAAGDVYYMPGIGEKLASMYSGIEAANPRKVLTERELEIFVLLASGEPPAKVARKLKLAPTSIRNRSVTIRDKLKCTRRDFQRVALRYHLID